MIRSLSCCFLGVYVVLGGFQLNEVDGHGMVLSPAGRGSRWRFNETAPKDYDDNGANCGGRDIQHFVHDGKCGICGDIYGDKTPRKHEIGGEFGEGIITGVYKQGAPVNVTVQITANHFGHFVFDICNLDNQTETDECFEQEVLTTEDDHFNLTTSNVGIYYVDLQLPNDVVCEHCVLRWTYVTGNSWGICGNGSGETGCGPQEQFRSCSDIKILSSESPESEVPETINAKMEFDSDPQLADDVNINKSMNESPQAVLKELSILLKALQSHLAKVDSVFKIEDVEDKNEI